MILMKYNFFWKWIQKSGATIRQNVFVLQHIIDKIEHMERKLYS